MSHHFTTDVLQLIKELVSKIIKVEEDTELFDHVRNYILTKLNNADSMYFMNKKQIDSNIDGLSEKFIFHGFFTQANDLKRLYERYIPSSTSKENLQTKLNVVKFLLCLSESPTNNFKNISTFIPIEDEEVIDWPTYLKEGIERWSPPVDSESSNWTDDTSSDHSFQINDVDGVHLDLCNQVSERGTYSLEKISPIIDEGERKRNIWNESIAIKEKLRETVQNSWFNQKHVYHLPESNDVDANVAIRWDDFLTHCTGGLVKLEKSNIVSEYKIMREIIWQLYVPHSSFCYEFVRDKLVPKENSTISSVRLESFSSFMYEFLPYIELLQDFTNFHECLGYSLETDVKPPETYRSYDYALQNMINPMYDEFLKLEDEIREQESMMTLLVLSKCLRGIFKNVLIIKNIHDYVIIDFKINTPLKCSTTLLSRLHAGLLCCISKTEQDIYLTLYLETLFRYIDIINSWLNKGVFLDCAEEFVIVDKVEKGDSDWQMEFVVQELDDFCENDSVLKIFTMEVFQIGKNLHLLRLLRKLHLIDDTSSNESIYDELIRKVLNEIAIYFQDNIVDKFDNYNLDSDVIQSPTYKFPVCPEYCKYPTEMDRLENLIDTTDGFLMNAFESFYIERPVKESRKEDTLFQKISKLTKSIFPAKEIIDDVLTKILRDRYSKLGYLVKNILINDYNIHEHLHILRHLFLFEDNLVFPLYQKLFKQFEMKHNWGNEVWLTGHLHDILMDSYPKLHEKCSIKVQQYWEECSDPLHVCEMINIQYRIKWPINILIRNEHMKMYNDIFGVILKIKWALHALNHLYFTEKLKRNKQKKIAKRLLRLNVLRFCLINEFTMLQHYLFSFVFNKSLSKLQFDFEKAYNLDSLIACHGKFINNVHIIVTTIGNWDEFIQLLLVVSKVKLMWNDFKLIEDIYLKKYDNCYRNFLKKLTSFMHSRNVNIEY